MKDESQIGWTDFTLNPWIGCTRVSPACLHCYAARYGARFGVQWGMGQPRRQTSKWQAIARTINRKRYRCQRCGGWIGEDQINEHVRNCSKDAKFLVPRKPSIFCGSLMDIFDQEVDRLWREQLFQIIAECTGIFWLLLTKRTSEMVSYVQKLPDWPWDHVALGTTAETQQYWDRRVPLLLDSGARLKFISVEPMLEVIRPGIQLPDWIILGGESGPRARQTRVSWIRETMQMIRAIDPQTKIMVKQLGCNPGEVLSGPQDGAGGRPMEIRDPRGAVPAEWPKDLQVQQVIKQAWDDELLWKDLIRDPE